MLEDFCKFCFEINFIFSVSKQSFNVCMMSCKHNQIHNPNDCNYKPCIIDLAYKSIDCISDRKSANICERNYACIFDKHKEYETNDKPCKCHIPKI